MSEKGSWAERLFKANREGRLEELAKEADEDLKAEHTLPKNKNPKLGDRLPSHPTHNPDEFITSNRQKRLEAEEDDTE